MMLPDKDIFLLDLAAYKESLSGEDNLQQIECMKKNLLKAIREELTPLQRKILVMYYYEKINIPEIARQSGVNKASVSKTLQRARDRLRRVLKYSV